MTNVLQKAIQEIGIDAVQKSITGAGMAMGFCDLHGHYAFTKVADCPVCPSPNGTTATEVEHYIDIKDAIDPTSGHNPGQVVNPTGISEQDIKTAKELMDKKE